jgi:hypothetical protein
MTNPTEKRMGLNRCLLDGVHFNVRPMALTRDDPARTAETSQVTSEP